MARKRKPGRPQGTGAKGSILSVRVSAEMRKHLEAAAARHKRKLSREIEARLDSTLGHYRKGKKDDALPPHIRGLLEAVAFTARVIEKATGESWHEDRYTNLHLAKAITCVMAALPEQSWAASPGKLAIPPQVTASAKTHIAGEEYPAHLGEEEARGILGWFRHAEEAHKMQSVYPHHFPEFLMEFWKPRRDLLKRRHK
jgi:hypothetical protein